LLVLLSDPVEAVKVATHPVLQPTKAIETTANVPEQNQPRPHRLDGRVDRVRAGVAEPGVRLRSLPGIKDPISTVVAPQWL
jgi:hypothetical protein